MSRVRIHTRARAWRVFCGSCGDRWGKGHQPECEGPHPMVMPRAPSAIIDDGDSPPSLESALCDELTPTQAAILELCRPGEVVGVRGRLRHAAAALERRSLIRAAFVSLRGFSWYRIAHLGTFVRAELEARASHHPPSLLGVDEAPEELGERIAEAMPHHTGSADEIIPW